MRERVLKRDLLVKFISSHDQPAHIFTKGLPFPRFHWLTSKLVEIPLSFEGDESLSNSQDEEEGTIPTVTPKTLSSMITVKQKISRLKANSVISH